MIAGIYFASVPFAGMFLTAPLPEAFFPWFAMQGNKVVGWRIQQV